MELINFSSTFAKYSAILLGVSVYPFACAMFNYSPKELPFTYPLSAPPYRAKDHDFDTKNYDNELSLSRNFATSNANWALEKYNEELEQYNHVGALLAWDISINMTSETLKENSKLLIQKNIWNNHWCGELRKIYDNGHSVYPWSAEQKRQLYLICRGPRFSSYQLNNVLSVLGSLQQLYNRKVCLKSTNQCMRMEPELNLFMERSRDEQHLRDAWLAWHENIGGEMKPLYATLIRMLNQGARQAGFRDMGECWREETEIDNLKGLATKLYSDVKYLYRLLHTFVRHKLEQFYGLKFNNGLIPAHLLGNMWAQKWDSLMDILWDGNKDRGSSAGLFSKLASSTSSEGATNLINRLIPNNNKKNITVTDMVKAAEDFFVSMGLPHLPKSFWEYSYFQEESNGESQANMEMGEQRMKGNSKNCHGSAANMFGGSEGDYRVLMCAQVNDADLITINHEIGHVMYFMAYSKLPTIFQEGANSAFHESVGDAITYDLLGLSSETGKNEMESLFKTALFKLPQIGFGLVMDMWRWKVFETPYKVSEWNKYWWNLNEEFLGITRPFSKTPLGDSLDAAGKFHIIENIPYIRYFFASFLQMQMYESMCTASTPFWNGNLHDCRIRNSKNAGHLLWNMMRKGTTKHWSKTLEEMTGTGQIKSEPLLKYYLPLQTWLEMQINQSNLTVGW